MHMERERRQITVVTKIENLIDGSGNVVYLGQNLAQA